MYGLTLCSGLSAAVWWLLVLFEDSPEWMRWMWFLWSGDDDAAQEQDKLRNMAKSQNDETWLERPEQK